MNELANANKPAQDSIVSLPHGERWFVDGFSVLPVPGGIEVRLVDLTHAQAALNALRARGLPATWTHLFVRAAALGLKRAPEAHQMVAGYRRLRPAHVDIGLSVAGQTNFAPVLIIPAAEERELPDLVAFMSQAVPATREKEKRDLEGMNRLGWIIPFGAVRRFILRMLGRSLWFRRKLIGTFQITCVSNIDFAIPLLFHSGTAMGVGRVTDRVMAVDGKPVVRPSVWLSMIFDHMTMDGRVCAAQLEATIRVLESDELLREAQGDSGHLALPAVAPVAATTRESA